MEEFSKTDKDKEFEIFWGWVEILQGNEHNQVCRFWAQMLIYLHAYTGFYFAVRLGNWLLRNSYLKLLIELFIAYSRDKYEVVSTNAFADSYTYPEIIEEFRKGQWTVSVKGHPFHCLAPVKAECIINRKLKQITTRPSHFRTVELSNFIAYLNTVISGLDSHVFKH